MAEARGHGRNLIAHGVVVALVATLVSVFGIAPGAAPVAQASEPVFEEDELEDAPRAEQPRDVASVTPARLLETRIGSGLDTIDGDFEGTGAIAAGGTINLQVTGRGGVPDTGVSAVLLNVTAVNPRANGFVTAYPCGSARPLAANLNYQPGENRPNAVVAKVGNGGTVCLYSKSATDLVVDVNGYVGDESSTKAVTPARLLETRAGAGFDTIDGEFEGDGVRAAGSTLELTVTGRGGVPGSNVEAVLLNVTAVNPRDLGFITAYPCGDPRPLAANLNYAPGANRPNAVLAKIGVAGKVCLFTRSAVDLVVDVNGYVETDDAETAATPLTPARLLETRVAPGLDTIDGDFLGVGSVAAGTTLELQVTGRGGVPDAGVGAAMLNVAAVNPQDVGFITVYPCGLDRPLAANLNYRPGQTVPNAVLARIGNGGKVCLFTRSTVDLVVDVNGYFGLAPNQPDSNVNVLDDADVTSVVFEPSEIVTSVVDDPLVPTPETATITTREDEGLDVGDMVVVEREDGTPYYGRVEQREDSTTVRAEEVALADVVPSMDVSLEVDTETGETVKNEGGSDVDDVEVDDDTKSPDEDKPKNQKCGGGLDIGVTASANVRPGNFVFDMSFNRTFTGLRSARIGYAPFVEATATIDAKVVASCELEKELFSKKLPNIKFVVSGVPVVITQEITVKVKGEISVAVTGSRTFEAGAYAFVGMVYEDGAWDRQATMDFDFSQSSTADFGVNFKLTVPEVLYTAKAYGIVGFEVGVSAVLELTYRPLAQKFLQLTASIEASAALVIELDLTVVTFRFAYEFARIRIFGPKELWKKEKASTICGLVPTQIPTSECKALVSLYNEADGSNWNSKGNWGTNTDPCTWPGVTCSGGHVIRLELVSRGVNGPIPAEIGDLVALQVFNLTNNNIASIPFEISNLGQLRELVLNTTNLPSVPNAINGLDRLEILELSSNALPSLPSLAGLRNLRELNLSFNDLEHLPYTVLGLTQIQSLDVRSNDIVALPSTLWDLTSLQFIDVSGNPIGDLPAGVGQLTNLTGLFAGDIGMTTVPDELGNLRQLDFLKLDSNEISDLPDSLAGLPRLERIYISFNEFERLPPELATYSTLTHLYMNGNPWNDDGTAVLSAVKNDNPDIVVLTVGNSGCLAITDPVVSDWVENLDFQYDPITSCPP